MFDLPSWAFKAWSQTLGVAPYSIQQTERPIRDCLMIAAAKFTEDTNSLRHMSEILIKKEFKFEWHYLESDFNRGARAANVNDATFIGIEYGLCLIMIDVARAMCRSKRFLNGELGGNDEICEIAQIVRPQSLLHGVGLNPEPVGELRLRATDLIVSTIIRYLLHHEFAHIWQAHIQLNNRTLRDSDRDGARAPSDEQYLIARASEWQADKRSVTAVTHWVLQEAGEDNLRSAQVLCVISFYISLRAVRPSDEIERTAETLKSHPSIKQRLVWGLEIIASVVSYMAKIERVEALNQVASIAGEIERLYSEMSGEQPLDLFSKEWIQTSHSAREELEQTWLSVRDLTRETMRGAVLPGVDAPMVDQVEQVYTSFLVDREMRDAGLGAA